jgi:hypothetical protein
VFFPAAIKNTFIENWNQDLLSLSFETCSIKLDVPDSWVLGGFTPLFRGMTGYSAGSYFSVKFLNCIDDALKKFPLVAPRIGFCSWKSPQIPILASYQSRGVLYTICSENERVARAIAAHLSSETALFLHLRKWHEIASWAEFRIFIRDRRVIGISQYHHQSNFSEISTNERAIKTSLSDFCRDLLDALHMDTVVADVFVERQENDRFRTMLIELNPFIQRTDPCLYTWKNGGDFEGGFRYREARDLPQAVQFGRQQLIDDSWQLPS